MSYRTNNAFDPDDSPDPNDDLAINAMSAEAAEEALEAAIPKAWDDDLPRNAKTGTLLNTFRVLCVILRSSPEFAGRLWWSEMLLRPMLDKEAVTEAMTGKLRERIEELHAIQPTPQNMRAAIISIARETPRHEAREWLLSLPAWDGTKRLARVPKEILGTTDALAPRLFARFCISAVARAFEPGKKVDTALVIAGPQGKRKSTFFALLAGEFFSDADIDIQNKDSVLQLYASWITEWSEIERVTSRKDASVVKAWLSRKDDLVRLPYGSAVEKFPRSSVIVGTTNKPDFLNDETGDRRFWVIEIQGDIKTERLLQWRDQLWAEAIAAYQAGEPWWLSKNEEAQREKDAKNFRESHPWEPIVEGWLRKNPFIDFLTTAQVLTEAVGMRAADIGHSDEVSVGKVMRALGWERVRPRKDNAERRRGYQKPKPQTKQPAETILDTCEEQVSEDWSSSSDGPQAVQYPVQSNSSHKIQGGPHGPVGSRAHVYGSDNASISNAASPFIRTNQLDHVDHVDHRRNHSEISVQLGKPGPVEASDRPPTVLPPATIDPLDLTDFLGDCAIVSRTGSELATVVVSLHGEWAKLHQRPQLSNVALMHALIEHGFTLAEDRVYGLEVRDSWIETLNAAEAAMERAAIAAESEGVE